MSPSGVRHPDTRMVAGDPLVGVVFDFDGVIADTERLHLQAYRDVLRNRGITLSTEDYEARYSDSTTSACSRRSRPTRGSRSAETIWSG